MQAKYYIKAWSDNMETNFGNLLSS
uniref:Uncharacterized protein n=1 Tax=Anguilla anguilla TaxID=7936 RepID=A0A0E9SYJ0_ANGAN